MEMGTIRTKVSRSHSEIIAFLSLTFCNPNPTYDITIAENAQNMNYVQIAHVLYILCIFHAFGITMLDGKNC